MARFPFVKGRKKSPPPLVLTEHMSKAHKILGSTPISIDSPKPWDDTFSAFGGGYENSTASSYASSENDDSDYHVAIASSEGDEWINHSGIRPAVPESSDFDNENERGIRNPAYSLRKTQSSSTIKSSYDRSKQFLPTSQQTSPPSMIKGVPSKVHKMLDLESNLATKSKRKPPRLDLSNLRAVSRLSRKRSHTPLHTVGTVSTAFESAATLSPTSLATPTSKPRRTQKRNTKGRLDSPALERRLVPKLAGERPPGSPMREAPSLYDHYEQMTLRQLMQEAESRGREQQVIDENIEDDEEVDTEVDEEPWIAYDLPWLQDILPPTPQTAFMTGLKPAASHHRSTSTTSKMTSSTKRSKTLDRSDLQETSMLMLSDSEEDDDPALPQFGTTNQSRHLPAATAPRAQSSRASSQASNYKSARNSKKTSFAPVDTNISLPQSSRLSTNTAIPPEVDSRSSTPYTGTIPSRTSLTSEVSSVSALQPGANYIQEARALTMLAGRRPPRVNNGEGNSRDRTSFMTGLSPAARRALSLAQTPPDELTPPLSPTSVDFFIRSARSSIDGSGSQNRYMAFTREEQILFSLRNKKRHYKDQPVETGQESKSDTFAKQGLGEENEEDEELFSDMEPIEGEAMLHFGFPIPPCARRRSCFEDALYKSARVHSRASTATSDKLSQSSMEKAENSRRLHQSSPRLSIAGIPPRGILKSPSAQLQDPGWQEAMMNLDDAELTLDMSDLVEFGYLAMPSLEPEILESSEKLDLSESDAIPIQSQVPDPDDKGMDRARRFPGAMIPVPEDSEMEYEGKDIPRPDSPISTDAFPAVPQKRTTLNSMARLSAVGSTSMMNRPGW